MSCDCDPGDCRLARFQHQCALQAKRIRELEAELGRTRCSCTDFARTIERQVRDAARAKRWERAARAAGRLVRIWRSCARDNAACALEFARANVGALDTPTTRSRNLQQGSASNDGSEHG